MSRYSFFIAAVAVISVSPAAAQTDSGTVRPLPRPDSIASAAATAVVAAAPLPRAPAIAGAPTYVPQRVYDARRKRFVDFETMVAALARADLVFLGEQHDDPGTHRLQAAVLEGLERRRDGSIVLALEMFERDAQAPLDAYLAGTLPESTFLATARPWPRYVTDYRPMVEFARSHGWPVIGGNVPRRLAQVVSRRGLAALDSIPEADRGLIASELACPRGRDEYWGRFRASMGDMSGHGMQLSPEELEATVRRMYEAQCVKDETMGEAIALAAAAHNTLVVHANGAFHSDRRLGTVARAKRRMPGARISVVSFVPVADLDAADGKSRRALGDWIVFTLAPPAAAAP